MKKVVTLSFLLLFVFSFNAFAQQDGNNKLFGVPNISLGIKGSDTLVAVAGRTIEFISGPNSLDGDALADIIVCDYNKGGRVHVFEQASKSSLDFKLVWSSPAKKALYNGTYPSGSMSTPRMVSYGDLDGNGKNEIYMPLGYYARDTIQSDTTSQRGIHVFECISDNNYGTTPFIIRPEIFDSTTRNINFGLINKPGIVVEDIDNDGKKECLIGTACFNFNKDISKNSGKAYVLSLKSGSFATKDAEFIVEYRYDAMAKALGDSDGYIPCGFTIADVDGDGKKEVVVTGRVNIGYGGSIGFFKATSPNTYIDGNIVNLTNYDLAETSRGIFRVTAILGKYTHEGRDVLFFNTDEASGNRRVMLMLDIVDISLVGANNFSVIKQIPMLAWTGCAVGDQDHGTGSDGFDVYIPYSSSGINDLEYNGTGNIADSASYSMNKIFDLNKVLKRVNAGIYQIIAPSADINENGKKELIVNSQIQSAGGDTLVNGNVTIPTPPVFFVIEWGDTLNGTLGVQKLNIITENDYKLEQNYPNPFNPSTTIRFSLPTPENMSLIIYDMNGREVKRIIDGQKFEKGTYEANWDGKNQYGSTVASGIYFYKLKWGNFEKSMKMTLLK